MPARASTPHRRAGSLLWAGFLVWALAASAAPRPKLTVLIVAEQFRPEYLDRYRASFSAGGFNRLLKGGAVFRECRYDYMATFPASGAALLVTGAYPDRTGIVADRWYDRRDRRVVSAVEDSVYAQVGYDRTKRPGASPRKLIGTTLADELRLATGGRSRAVSISLRDQTAVLLGGRKPAGCYWLDDAGRFVTSTYYTEGLPAWVLAFTKSHPPLRFKDRPWRAVDAAQGAPPLRVVNGKEAYLASPFALDEELEFAREALVGEQLGQGAASDLLVVSLSPFYLLGLETGAESPLMRDMVLRLDRQLEDFFSWLDARLGADKVWIAFTATQGLAELPETAKAEWIRAGRVPGEAIVAAVNARLADAFGRNSYVEKYVFPYLYLRRDAVKKLPEPITSEMLRLAGEAALGVGGVAGYLAPNGPSSFQAPETARQLGRCWFPERAGDVLIAYQPYYIELYGDGRGVAPGSFYSYDTRVPLLLYGAAFRAEVFEQPVSPADLAATLASALQISPPSSSTGHVLADCLKER